MAHRYSSNITLSGAANVDEHLDVGVSGRHVVEQRCGLRIGCSLADIHGRNELTQQDASAWRFDRFVKVFEVLENVVEVKQTLTENVWFVGKIEDRFRHCGHCLTGRVGGKVDGQIGQPEDTHQRYKSLLLNKLSAVIVS